MERLTSLNINVDPDTDRFLHAAIGGKEIDWKQCRDSTLNVLINGPTSNGFGKDIFRKMVRDLYGRLKAYEDTGLTPEEIKAPFTEDAMINLAAQALGVEPSRLRELAEADRNHQIVIRPCKIGDTVWAADTEPVIPLHVMADAVYLEGRHGGDYERLSNFGSVVFLSQEEAKEAASHWMK
jgi:hypothetical protein